MAIPKHALANATTQAADRLSAIELAGEVDKPAERYRKIGAARPAIDVAVEAPILTAIIST